jgi:hypothetical protein
MHRVNVSTPIDTSVAEEVSLDAAVLPVGMLSVRVLLIR